MPDTQLSRGFIIAANLWTEPTTENCVMQPEVATVAARKFDLLLDTLEDAWCVIANVGGGNWASQTPEWQKAAACLRDRYNFILANRALSSDAIDQIAPAKKQPEPADSEAGNR